MCDIASLIKTLTWELQYQYDTFNRRVARQVTRNVAGVEGGTTSTTTTEKFIYDGDHVVLDFYKPSGGSYSLDHRYLYGPAVDQVLAQENLITRIGYTSVASIPTSDTSRVYWLLTDNLGTVRDILDKNGDLVSGGHFKYDAFGQFASDNTGDVTLTRYLFTAREFDSITGLQYNRNRWYDSKTGRWLSEDPIGFEGGDYNLYRYVGNDPTNKTDPSGLVGKPGDKGDFGGPEIEALKKGCIGLAAIRTGSYKNPINNSIDPIKQPGAKSFPSYQEALAYLMQHPDYVLIAVQTNDPGTNDFNYATKFPTCWEWMTGGQTENPNLDITKGNELPDYAMTTYWLIPITKNSSHRPPPLFK